MVIFNQEIGFKQILGLAALLFLVAAIPVGMYLVRQQQILKSKATLEGTRVEILDQNDNPITQTQTRDVKLKLTYVPGSLPNPSPSAAPATVSSPSPRSSPTPRSIYTTPYTYPTPPRSTSQPTPNCIARGQTCNPTGGRQCCSGSFCNPSRHDSRGYATAWTCQ